MISIVQGWSRHWKSLPPMWWCKPPLQTNSEITQSMEGTALMKMGESLACCQNLQMSSITLLNDISTKWRLLSLQIKSRSDVVEASTATPATQCLLAARITLWWKRMLWPWAKMWRKLKINSSRGLSWGGRNPKQEFLQQPCWTAGVCSLSLKTTKSIIYSWEKMVVLPSSYTIVSSLSMGPTSLGFSFSRNLPSFSIALYHNVLSTS